MVRIQKMGAAFLALLLLSGCAGMDAAPPGEVGETGLAIAAQFQTEHGDALHGGAALFSAEGGSDCRQVGRDGTVSVSGLPRTGELYVALLGQQQEVRGSMTLSLAQGGVIDAMTSEDGVGHITVRDDTREVALMFVLTEDGALRCTLWLAGSGPSGAGLSQKGV